jgi:phage protein D
VPKFTPIPYIKIDGQDISTDLMGDLLEIVVDTSLYLPSMFTIKFHDKYLKWIDDASLDIGKPVEISIKVPEDQGNAKGLLIKGEITALEPCLSAGGTKALLIRGYDKSHRLHRGQKTRTFLKMTDSEIAIKVAGDAGLTPVVDSTTIVYDYILQNNQTNLEFLHTRAERIGYQVYSAEGKLYFKKGDAPADPTPAPELVFLENLTDFQPRWTVAHQSDKMIVKGWDPKQKKELVGQATPSLTQGGVGSTGVDKAKAAFRGSAAETVVDQPVSTQDEANALAKGLSQNISREALQAEGVCAGDPQVQAGRKVTISKVGTRFSGTYFITSATHIYSASGYETRFSITGWQPNTLSHLLESHPDEERGLMHGVVVGLVTNLKDPDDLGRVKVKYPWLGDNIESDWIRLASPMAGSGRGFLYLPEVNDEVLIAFEHGDVHHPYIVGALWSSTDKPFKKNSEVVGSDGKVNQRLIQTRAGHVILFDDKQGEEKVSITSKSGHTVILDDKSGSESITIKDKSGNNKLVIDSTTNSMTINVNGDFTVEAKGKVSIKSTQAMALESMAKATVKGTSGLSLDGTSQAELKGAQVSVNGSAMTEVKGGLVKIN